MDNIRIKEQKAHEGKWLFVINIGTEEYRVTLDRDYWLELTGKNLTPGQLVLYAFMFLLDHEPQKNILREFDLRLVQKNFPNFEDSIRE